MSIYYVQSQPGQYHSENKNRSFDRLEGANAQEYLRIHKGLSFITTVTDILNGEVVFIEVPDNFKKEVVSEKNHQRYVKAVMKGSNLEVVSFQQPFTEGEDLTYEDIIASPYANVEDIVIRKIDLETLHSALSVLSSYEMMIVNALYLSDFPISERELSRRLGIPQKTLNNRKKRILNKLRSFF